MQRAEDVADRLRSFAVAPQRRGHSRDLVLVQAIDWDAADGRLDVHAQMRLDGFAMRFGSTENLEVIEQRAPGIRNRAIWVRDVPHLIDQRTQLRFGLGSGETVPGAGLTDGTESPIGATTVFG